MLLTCWLQPELRKNCWSLDAEEHPASHPVTCGQRVGGREDGQGYTLVHVAPMQPGSDHPAWQRLQATLKRLYTGQQLQLGAEDQLSCFIHPNCRSPLQKSIVISSLEELFHFLLFSALLQCSRLCRVPSVSCRDCSAAITSPTSLERSVGERRSCRLI